MLFSNAQQQNFALEKGNCMLFGNHIYAYGFRPGALCIYKHDLKLRLQDSAFYIFSDHSKCSDYFNISCDTLHQTLNFYMPKKDKQKATLVRYDKQLKLQGEYKNMEVTKVNPLAGYDQQKLVYKNSCYVIKGVSDTSGKQYYLSQFELNRSTEKPFDYAFRWQFNFEKKHIRNIHVFYADAKQVLAYVHINNGDRKGEWLLKINATNGLLIKGKKISGNSGLNYRFSNFTIDTVSKDLFIAGQLTAGEMLASATPTLFILQFDSLLTPIGHKQIVAKINSANPKSKGSTGYLVQISGIRAKPNSAYQLSLDFYKNQGNEFKYCNTATEGFSVEDGELTADPLALREYPEIENYYFTPDKKDLNGKLFIDTTYSSDRLFYRPPVFPVKLAYKLNEKEMPVWLLKKDDLKTRTINYSVLQPGLKLYEVKALQNIPKDDEPNVILLDKNTFLLNYTKTNSILHIELGSW